MSGPWPDLMFNMKDAVLVDGVRLHKWAYIRAHRAQFIPLAHAYREAAKADGWQCEPLYGDHEPVEQAARLMRDGFIMHVMARPHGDTCPMPSVSIWGPDGAAIKPPLEYDWDAIVAGARICGECGATDVDTTREAFANRVCGACREKFLASLPKNWAD